MRIEYYDYDSAAEDPEKLFEQPSLSGPYRGPIPRKGEKVQLNGVAYKVIEVGHVPEHDIIDIFVEEIDDED